MLEQNKVNPSNLLSGQMASDLKVGDKKIRPTRSNKFSGLINLYLILKVEKKIIGNKRHI